MKDKIKKIKKEYQDVGWINLAQDRVITDKHISHLGHSLLFHSRNLKESSRHKINFSVQLCKLNVNATCH
jgi:hypothetical protein